MTTNQNIFNFSAGPTALPFEVMQDIQNEFLSFGSAKASVMEISHRSVDFMEIYHNMQKDLRDLMNIPDNYKILFTRGGASAQFSMVPINLLSGKKTANYALTGHWGEKAVAEANRYTKVNISTDSTANNWTDIADFNSWNIDEKAAYLHYTPNETIAGLEFDFVPEVGDMPIVADMSSNILSKQIDVSKFGIIYAGAQKNIGAAGLTVVIVREDLIGNANQNMPKLFDYKTYSENDSMFNTPNTFAWYSAYKVFKWLKDLGGVEKMEKINQEKANILYGAIDNSDFYSNPVAKNYRSKMNVPFILKDDKLNELFLKQSFENDLLALKGHKSVGGMRASIYNAMPICGVQQLVDFMAEFERKNG
jgi:phosphoserine aminotransferase